MTGLGGDGASAPDRTREAWTFVGRRTRQGSGQGDQQAGRSTGAMRRGSDFAGVRPAPSTRSSRSAWRGQLVAPFGRLSRDAAVEVVQTHCGPRPAFVSGRGSPSRSEPARSGGYSIAFSWKHRITATLDLTPTVMVKSPASLWFLSR